MCDNIFINDKEVKIQADTTKIIEVWKQHHVELLNVTNPWKDLKECEKTCGPIPNVTLEEDGTQLKKKTGNASGPDQIPIELWKLLSYRQWTPYVLKESLNHGEWVKYHHCTRVKVLSWNVGIIEESSWWHTPWSCGSES